MEFGKTPSVKRCETVAKRWAGGNLLKTQDSLKWSRVVMISWLVMPGVEQRQ